jgi:hypothetical protein
MSKWPMRGHFRYLRFKTFPMTPGTPQCEVFWALLSSSKHSESRRTPNPHFFQVLGFTPTLGQSRVATSHITQGHIPCRIAHILGAPHLLAMTKFLGGVRLLIVRETLYQFTSHVFMPLILRHLCNTFSPIPIRSNNQGWIWNNNPWH